MSSSTIRPVFDVPSLVELYSRPYDDRMTEWRRRGAVDKAQNLRDLAQAESFDAGSVLEVGCGTGQVMVELARQGFGGDFTGVEIGTERSASPTREVEGKPVKVIAYDGTVLPFPDRSFDLVYATHVLEHVVDQRSFLHELRRVSKRFVYIEVPLDIRLSTSLKDLQTGLDVGHINCYTRESFALTLATSGLEIVNLRVFDHSYDVHAFKTAAPKAMVKMALRRLALGLSPALAAKIFSYHSGALCRAAPTLDIVPQARPASGTRPRAVA